MPRTVIISVKAGSAGVDACESACPVNAIYKASVVPEELIEFVDLNQQWFEDKDSVRQQHAWPHAW